MLAGCGDGGGGGGDRPGSTDVYAEIEAETDCDKLQTDFDRNMDDFDRRESGDPLRDVVLSYAEAADARMEEVGCYE